uniref:Uncharacterized protein n=1 Tax=Anguilla anguilla TaxID=7936 RepID=A0A0E9QCJ1_ANGAN
MSPILVIIGNFVVYLATFVSEKNSLFKPMCYFEKGLRNG